MSQGASLLSVETRSVADRARRPRQLPLSELAAANRQRDALYLLSEELHGAATNEEIYAAAMDSIESALDCDRSAILLFDADGVMQFVDWRGLSDAYRHAVTGHSPWRPEESDARPLTVDDVSRADLPEKLKADVLDEGIHAVAFIPLVSEGALIGKFMAYFREAHTFTNDDVAVSLTIARQLSHALQRSRVDARLREREAELAEELNVTRMLQSLSIEMAHEVDVEALYARLVNVARIIMRSDFATMQQYFKHLGAHGELKLISHHGLNAEAAEYWAWVRADTRSTCGAALLQRERVLIEDFEKSAFMHGSEELSKLLAAGIRSAQTTPLLTRRGELVGMITTHWTKPHKPSERDLWLLDIVARLASDLIERKKEDEEQRRREERLRALTGLLSDVPWQAQADGAFAELQPAWENYTGQSWDAHSGHGWFDAIHQDDRSAVQASWAAACFSAQPYVEEARLWSSKAREYRACVIRATPIRNDDGSVREWVGACTESVTSHS